VPQAIALWRRAYRHDPRLRATITQQLAPQLPAHYFVEQFAISTAELPDLYQFYQRQHLDENAAAVAKCLVERLVGPTATEDVPASVWRSAYTMATQQGDHRAVTLARRAVELDPYDYAMRRRLALELLARQNWAEAAGHLEWCLEQNRADRSLADKLAIARRGAADTTVP
jgi:hypothetical protein